MELIQCLNPEAIASIWLQSEVARCIFQQRATKAKVTKCIRTMIGKSETKNPFPRTYGEVNGGVIQGQN